MMKFSRINIYLLFAVMLTLGCGSTKTNSKDTKPAVESKRSEVVIAKLYDYRVVAEYPHSTKSYTQGLQYVDGVMWEGTGREGRSHLQTIDLKTGKVNILIQKAAEQTVFAVAQNYCRIGNEDIIAVRRDLFCAWNFTFLPFLNTDFQVFYRVSGFCKSFWIDTKQFNVPPAECGRQFSAENKAGIAVFNGNDFAGKGILNCFQHGKFFRS